MKKLKSALTNLNKFIAASGYSSRREADRLIKEKRVKINDKIAIPTDKVSENDKVFIDDKEIKPTTKKIYLAFNKPIGVICTTDEKSPNNIMSYINIPERVFPVGRLDVNSEGLILLTNDGELANIIMKAKTIEKEYIVKVDKSIDDQFLKNMADGHIIVDGYPVLPAKVGKIDDRSFTITITEGRKRQIRRMCDKLKYNVTGLMRNRIGGIKLNNIPLGKYITIDEQNIYGLLGM